MFLAGSNRSPSPRDGEQCVTRSTVCQTLDYRKPRVFKIISFSPARGDVGHTGSDIDGPAKTLKAGDHGVPVDITVNEIRDVPDGLERGVRGQVVRRGGDALGPTWLGCRVQPHALEECRIRYDAGVEIHGD